MGDKDILRIALEKVIQDELKAQEKRRGKPFRCIEAKVSVILRVAEVEGTGSGYTGSKPVLDLMFPGTDKENGFTPLEEPIPVPQKG